MKLFFVNIFDLFNGSNKTSQFTASLDEPIGCIAQSIIQDLHPDNASDWYYACITAFYYSVKNRRRNYVLNIGLRDNGDSKGYIAALEGLDTVKFNKIEIAAINDAALRMYRFLKEQKDNLEKQKDLAKLKTMFPECFETSYNLVYNYKDKINRVSEINEIINRHENI
jgi:hypothetical protein